MPTEKTPLTGPSPKFGSAPAVPFYVQDTHRFYSRRRRERQLQCIMFVAIVAAFIMALIVTISYSVNHADIIPSETNASQDTVTGVLKSSEPGSPLSLKASDTLSLSDEEVKEALAAGNAAIAARRLADSTTKPLASPSPNSRHQYAVSTSSRANQLALGGIAEIAATRKIENSRSFTGKPSSFGSFIDGGWTPENMCVQNQNIKCPMYAAKYRTFDGSCNHPEQFGMAFTPFRRALPPDYADGIDAPRVGKFGNPLPSAREVSLKVHPPSPSTNPSFTVMLAVFGQFLDHDITATALSQGTSGSSLSCCPPSGGHPECFPVKVGPGDPVYDVAGSSCMEFVRSAPAPQCKIGPRQQLNQVTAFIDGSTIYGSDVETAKSLREFSGGRLRMQSTSDKRVLLPASTNPKDGCNRQVELARGRYCFATGDPRANENLHLTTMHLLWARQHNRLADQLAQLNPQWDDEKLYQETRKVVGAQLQYISYNEFLPIVLGEAETSRRNLQPLAAGFRTRNESHTFSPAITNHFATAAFRFAHTLLPGLMKVTDKGKGTSSYIQLHKMLFNPYSLYAEGGVESSITTATSNTIQKMSTHVTSQLTEHLFEDPMGNKTVPCGLDLVSLNIQRGRDHGLPGYTKWREYCGLQKPLKFEDLKDDMDAEALDAISKLYDNVDDVDLYTGALAEVPQAEGLVGPTFTCLIADQFERLQLGDKYWYETAAQPGSFNEDQLRDIRKTTLARLICDTSDGITEVQAQVMRSVGPDNPIISCEDIPPTSLDAWKTELPVLMLKETEVPLQDWLSFKEAVNKTINDIVSSIIAKKPPAGSLPTDWLAFQKDINWTFTDLKDKFSALHPKIVTNVSLSKNLCSDPEVFDWASIKDEANKTVSEILDSINANKSFPGSLPADWLVFKKKINDSLIDIRKKFKVIHPKMEISKQLLGNLKEIGAISVIDWNEIKSNINATITDVVNSINASKPLPGSTPADWFAFKKKIIDSLAGKKNKFKGLHAKPAVPVETLNKNGDQAVFDWVEFKDQLNKSLTYIIASTVAKQPPPGSSPADWLHFQKEINSTFAQFMNQFLGLHPKPANENDDVEISNETSSVSDDIKNTVSSNVNNTITDIATLIKTYKPPPGSTQEDWLAFQQKISNTFANTKNKYAYLYLKNTTKPSVRLSISPEDPTFHISAFREDLNKSLSDLISLIKTKKPAVDSPVTDWLAYKTEIKASVSEIKNQFSGFKTKELLEPDYVLYATENDPTFDWVGWKNQINKRIDGLLDDIKCIPAGDLKWASFRDYLDKTFTDLKNKVADVRTKVPTAKLMAIINEDWLDFKDQINSTIEDALDYINSNKPQPGDPSWVDYNIDIKNKFAQIREDLIAIKAEWLDKVKVATEMMIVTSTQSPSTSSASTLNTKLFGSTFHLKIGIIITIFFFYY